MVVVGEMKWNPHTLRWEGNDQVLKDFDAATGTSTRPALITHLTGSSIGSPVGSFAAAAGARIVGTMVFDPAQMRWISTLPPDEDEPDVFADLADDEDDDWEAQAGTIRASQQQQAQSSSSQPQPQTQQSQPQSQPNSQSQAHSQQSSSSSSGSTRADSASSIRSRRHTRANSESESDRCSRASIVCEVDDAFWEKCRAAEERHRAELKGWIAALPPPSSSSSSGPSMDVDFDRSYLYEIRALATRQY